VYQFRYIIFAPYGGAGADEWFSTANIWCYKEFSGVLIIVVTRVWGLEPGMGLE
jgi:hypothetical protein